MCTKCRSNHFNGIFGSALERSRFALPISVRIVATCEFIRKFTAPTASLTICIIAEYPCYEFVSIRFKFGCERLNRIRIARDYAVPLSIQFKCKLPVDINMDVGCVMCMSVPKISSQGNRIVEFLFMTLELATLNGSIFGSMIPLPNVADKSSISEQNLLSSDFIRFLIHNHRISSICVSIVAKTLQTIMYSV